MIMIEIKITNPIKLPALIATSLLLVTNTTR
jgi:hypothetical protein